MINIRDTFTRLKIGCFFQLGNNNERKRIAKKEEQRTANTALPILEQDVVTIGYNSLSAYVPMDISNLAFSGYHVVYIFNQHLFPVGRL